MKFDEERIARLFSEIFNALKGMRELSELERDDFLSQPLMIAGAKYFLIVSIEAAIDMSYHLISKNKLRLPNDYADTFRVMGEQGFFEEDFVKKLVEMARFRNRLVHIYWDVDDNLIYEIIRVDIQDIEQFAEEIINLLNKTP